MMLSACVSMMKSDHGIKSEIIEHSYVEKTGGQLFEDDSRVTGLLNVGYDVVEIKRKTWEIPNKLGSGLYLGVKFTKIPAEINSFDLRVSFPEMTLPSGEKRRAISRTIDLIDHNGEYEWFFDFYFDFMYEMNPGPWKIQVFNGNDEVHSSTFYVVDSSEQL